MATNTYGNYNEAFFAQEALPLLENALGLAGRVYREFERDTKEVGDTTQIRKPSTGSGTCHGALLVATAF